MSYHGDIRLGDTLDLKFCTAAAATGAPTTLAGSPTVAAYPGNSTTEVTSGITLTVDFDSRTGCHNVRVVATSGNGYATATNYELVLTAGTVGGTSVVGYVVGSFSIENRSALMPATAARTLVVDANGLADANAVKLGPTGSGTAQTARDIGASVLLSSGTGTGQLSITSGIAAVNTTQFGGSAGTFSGGRPEVNTSHVAGTAQTAGNIVALLNALGCRRKYTCTAQGAGQSAGATPAYVTMDASAGHANIERGDMLIVAAGSGVGGSNFAISFDSTTKKAEVRQDWGSAGVPNNTSTIDVYAVGGIIPALQSLLASYTQATAIQSKTDQLSFSAEGLEVDHVATMGKALEVTGEAPDNSGAYTVSP